MNQGNFWELRQVVDECLLEDVRRLVRADRRVSARLLAHLAEVEERRLHLKHAKPSMFEYCIELGMSEDEAGRRLCAASVAKRFPEVYRMLDEGRLCLSVICKLKHYLTDANHRELLAGVAGMSYRRAEAWLAARFPQRDAPSTVRKLPERSTLRSPGGLDPSRRVEVATAEIVNASEVMQVERPTPTLTNAGPSTLSDSTASVSGSVAGSSAPVSGASPSALGSGACASTAGGGIARDAVPGLLVAHPGAGVTLSGPTRPVDRGRTEPLAADRYRVQFTANAELKAKLELAADLMAHRNPSRDFAAIVERALDLLIAELQKQKFGKTRRPRPGRPAKPDRVTRETQRAVLERDGLRCSYVGENGRRCTGRAFLERDHEKARGKGGGPGVENIRHLCRQHNQWLAEIEYGREHMDRARAARGRRDKRNPLATSRSSSSGVETETANRSATSRSSPSSVTTTETS